jgi:putative ABC transport system substrate-binding protein
MTRATITFTLVAVILAASPCLAERSAKRVLILGPAEEPRFSELAAAFRQGLRAHGYGDTLIDVAERKVTRGDQAAARIAVEAAARGGASAVFAIGSELAHVARQASANLQIVFITPGDPVTAGLLASLNRPGSNMTAVTFEYPELSAKRLEIVKLAVPSAQRILVLYDPRDSSPRQGVSAARIGAAELKLELVIHETKSALDVTIGLRALASVDALLAIPGGLTSAHYKQIIDSANAVRVPTVFHSRSASTADALASYGASDANVARDAARLVSKVLNGENAGDIPVERPTKIELSVNLKTAKTIGLTVPQTLLVRADEVIE